MKKILGILKLGGSLKYLSKKNRHQLRKGRVREKVPGSSLEFSCKNFSIGAYMWPFRLGHCLRC